MHSHIIRIVFLFSAVVCLSETSEAQSAVAPLSANDSIFRRARRLVSDGNGVAGRALVDSMIRVSDEGTPAYGDAIFWRGALAETAADAERDYRRVIVEYPLSPYADDALLSLAELEQARGDRTAAFQHLQRFVREHPVGTARARAGLAAARLAFEQRDQTRGCEMIADARTSAGSTEVELRNQIEYYGARCPTGSVVSETGTGVVASGAPSSVAAPTPSAPSPKTASTSTTNRNAKPTPAPAAKPETKAPTRLSTKSETAKAVRTKPATAKPTTAKPTTAKSDSAPSRATAPAPHGTWTIQLAAYATRPDADRLIAKLAGRGVKARISGKEKPFRVRLDYYKTRQEAAAAVAELKERGIIGFVTEEARPSAGSSP